MRSIKIQDDSLSQNYDHNYYCPEKLSAISKENQSLFPNKFNYQSKKDN